MLANLLRSFGFIAPRAHRHEGIVVKEIDARDNSESSVCEAIFAKLKGKVARCFGQKRGRGYLPEFYDITAAPRNYQKRGIVEAVSGVIENSERDVFKAG